MGCVLANTLLKHHQNRVEDGHSRSCLNILPIYARTVDVLSSKRQKENLRENKKRIQETPRNEVENKQAIPVTE
jgi:hypothetical protein